MLLSIQLSFNRATLTRLLTKAVRKWSGLCEIDSLTINGHSDGHVSGYAMMKFAGKNNMIHFSHDVIVAGICESLAAESQPIDKASLVFTYIESLGYGGGGASVSATANPASADAPKADAASSPAPKAGSIIFPGTVTIHFGIDELTDLLNAAVKRAGFEPTYASVLFTDEKTCAANIFVKTKGGTSGTITLSSKQTNETLIDELTQRGYTVAANGLRYSHSQGSYGSRSGTSVSVILTAVPV